MSDERILEVSQVARKLRVCPKTVRNYCEAKLLRAYDIGTRTRRHWRIYESSLSAVNPAPEPDWEAAVALEERAEKTSRAADAEKLAQPSRPAKRI